MTRKNLIEKMRAEATVHELSAAKMLKCARRLHQLAGKSKRTASRLREARNILEKGAAKV